MENAARHRDPPDHGSHPDLQVETRQDRATTVVAVRGDVDTATAPLLRTVLDSVWLRRPSRVELDLSTATFLDARALAILIVARRRLADLGASVVIRTSSAAVRDMLLLVMDGELDVVHTEASRGDRS